MTATVASCMECTWTQPWPTKDEAERSETWHVYDAHPDVWRYVMGDRTPGVRKPGWIVEPDSGSVQVVGGRYDGTIFTREPKASFMLRWQTTVGGGRAGSWAEVQQAVMDSGGRLEVQR